MRLLLSVLGRRDTLHEVFEPSFDIKECFTKKFIIQKLNYIHNNPCSGKWYLAGYPENYVHSSAGYYYKGIQGIFPIRNIMELMDIDLSEKI